MPDDPPIPDDTQQTFTVAGLGTTASAAAAGRPPRYMNAPEQQLMLRDGTPFGELRKTPALLYPLFTELTRQFYTVDTDYEYNSPPLVWNQSPTAGQREVWIDAEYVWNDKKIEFRPAIYIGLGNITYTSVPSVGKGASAGRIGADLDTGEYYYQREGKGQVRLVHIGLTQTQTVEMISHTLDLYDAFADVIRCDYCFHKFSVNSLAPPKPGKVEDREKFHGTVTLDYEFVDTWTLKQEAAQLRHVLIKAGLRCAGQLKLDMQL